MPFIFADTFSRNVSGTAADDDFGSLTSLSVTMSGGNGDDFFLDGTASDVLNGDAGEDAFILSGGADLVNCGPGDDRVGGIGQGNDTIAGGPGNDQFVLNSGVFQSLSNPLIVDFSPGDILRFVTDAATLTGFVSVGADTTEPFKVGVHVIGGQTKLLIDKDGNTAPDYVVSLSGVFNPADLRLGPADFSGQTQITLAQDPPPQIPINGLVINADDSANVLVGGSQGDSISGGAGSDTIFGFELADIIDGGSGNDVIFSDLPGDGGDSILGGDGSDTVFAFGGNDTVVGGNESDLFVGDDGDDSLDGDDGDDVLFGGAGIDSIEGGNGVDFLFGDGGSDTIEGGAGNDRVHMSSEDAVADGGDGIFDVLVVTDIIPLTVIDLSETDDQAPGQALIAIGFEAVDASIATQGLAITGATVPGGFGCVLFGSPFVDVIAGSSAADIILGNGGSDLINGGNGNDTIIADSGDDLISGGNGADNFFYPGGAAAGEVIIFDFSPVADTVSLGAALGLTPQQARAQIQQVGADAVLTFGPGQSLELMGVQVSALTAADFVIV